MDFDLTEEQEMLRQSVADFVKQRSPVERFRELRDSDAGYDKKMWREMGELGWLSLPFPESVDGFGGTFADVCIVLQELGKNLVPEPFLSSVVLGGMTILRAGNAEQHAAYLPKMIAGEQTLALAYAERGSRYGTSATATAEKNADGYVLNGEKIFALGAHAADHIVCSAKTDDGVGLFVVDPKADGVEITRVRAIDGRHAGWVKLTGAQVAPGAVLTTDGEAILDRVLDYAATAAVAEGNGVAQRMLDVTVEYLKTREQFGVPIGFFQALQHRAVEMFVEVQLLGSIGLEAYDQVDNDDDESRRASVSAAKHLLGQSGQKVSREAVQLHGGVGVTDEHDIGLYFKRMQALSGLFGDSTHHVKRFAARDAFTS